MLHNFSPRGGTTQLNELRIKEQRVLDQLVSARQRERVANSTTRPTQWPFRVGDRVTITNGIAKVTDRQANQNDNRDSVVTKVEGEKIHILTNNGFPTWRKSKNVQFA